MPLQAPSPFIHIFVATKGSDETHGRLLLISRFIPRLVPRLIYLAEMAFGPIIMKFRNRNVANAVRICHETFLKISPVEWAMMTIVSEGLPDRSGCCETLVVQN
jgi:hypothetical protein